MPPTEIDVSALIDDLDPAELSAGRAERGDNAGPETWHNAKDAAPALALSPDDMTDLRRYFGEFGAWEAGEIEAWAETEIAALVLQMAAGDLRELQSLAPGKGVAGVNWRKAERLSQEGAVSGNLFPSGKRLFFGAY